MAASLPSLYGLGLGRLGRKSNVRLSLKTRAQNSADEGNSSVSMVDKNLGVLKERMEKVRTRERLQKRCRDGEGWYYQKQYDVNLKRNTKVSEALEVVELAVGTFGLTILGCTFCLCLLAPLMAYLGR